MRNITASAASYDYSGHTHHPHGKESLLTLGVLASDITSALHAGRVALTAGDLETFNEVLGWPTVRYFSLALTNGNLPKWLARDVATIYSMRLYAETLATPTPQHLTVLLRRGDNLLEDARKYLDPPSVAILYVRLGELENLLGKRPFTSWHLALRALGTGAKLDQATIRLMTGNPLLHKGYEWVGLATMYKAAVWFWLYSGRAGVRGYKAMCHTWLGEAHRATARAKGRWHAWLGTLHTAIARWLGRRSPQTTSGDSGNLRLPYFQPWS